MFVYGNAIGNSPNPNCETNCNANNPINPINVVPAATYNIVNITTVVIISNVKFSDTILICNATANGMEINAIKAANIGPTLGIRLKIDINNAAVANINQGASNEFKANR